MTYLELCQSLRQRAGIGGGGPSAVASQTGELALVVSLIDTAYEDIQDMRADWTFMTHEFTFDCTSAVSNYVPATVSNVANWNEYSFRTYLASTGNETYLRYVPWEIFRDTRLFSSSRDNTGRPIEITIPPDKSLTVWPIPDATYTIGGQYVQQASVMALDADVPIFDRYHLVIMYSALEQYAGDVGLPTIYAIASKEKRKLLNRMYRDYLPKITVGRSMA